MSRALELLGKLAVDDPYSRSSEGLDDCCMFCGGWQSISVKTTHGFAYTHADDCPWFDARNLLGLDIPSDHVKMSAVRKEDDSRSAVPTTGDRP